MDVADALDILMKRLFVIHVRGHVHDWAIQLGEHSEPHDHVDGWPAMRDCSKCADALEALDLLHEAHSITVLERKALAYYERHRWWHACGNGLCPDRSGFDPSRPRSLTVLEGLRKGRSDG